MKTATNGPAPRPPFPRLTVSVAILLLFPGGAAAVSTECPNEGTAYAVLSYDSVVAVDLATGAATSVASGLPSALGLALNASETKAYVSAATDLLRIDLATGAVDAVGASLSAVTGVAVNRLETKAYVTERNLGQLLEVDLATGATTLVASGLGEPRDIKLDRSDSLAYVTEENVRELSVIDLSTGVVTLLATFGSFAAELDLNTVETKAYVSAGGLHEVDLSTGAVTMVSALSGGRGVAVNGVDTTAYVADSMLGELVAVDLATGSSRVIATGLTSVTAVALSRRGCRATCPNEDVLYHVIGDTELRRFYPATGATDTVTSSLFAVRGLAVNRALTKAYVTQYATGTIEEVNLLTGGITTLATALSGPWGLALSADETTAWVAEELSGEVSAVDLGSGIVTAITTAGLAFPRGIAVDASESVAYVVDYQIETLVSVDLGTGATNVIATGLTGGPVSVALSPSGATAYVGTMVPADVYSVGLPGGSVSLLYSPLLAGGLAPNREGTMLYVGHTGQLGRLILASKGLVELTGPNTGWTPVALASTPCQEATIFPSRPDPGTGSTLAACAMIDVRDCPDLLGSYGATLSWDPAMLSYASSTGGDPPFGTPVVNDGSAGAGILTFADADPTGAGGYQHVLCAEFDVIGATGAQPVLDLELTSLYAAGSFADLLPTALVQDVGIEIRGQCVVGDVNADVSVNSGDALIILSDEILLPIPQAYADLLVAGCGDANGDAATDSIDANIVMSYEVGLPIDPLYPIAAPIKTFDSCPICSSGGESTALLSTVTLGPEADGPPPVARLVFPAARIRRGDLFDVVVRLDMADTGVTLGSYGAVLEWSPQAAEWQGASPPGPGAFAGPLLNRAEATAGILRFAQADPGAAEGDIELARFRFRAARALPHPERLFSLRFTSLGGGAPGFDNLLRRVAPADGAAAAPAD